MADSCAACGGNITWHKTCRIAAYTAVTFSILMFHGALICAHRDALSAAHMEGLVTCCHCSVPMLLEEDAGKYAVMQVLVLVYLRVGL